MLNCSHWKCEPMAYREIGSTIRLEKLYVQTCIFIVCVCDKISKRVPRNFRTNIYLFPERARTYKHTHTYKLQRRAMIAANASEPCIWEMAKPRRRNQQQPQLKNHERYARVSLHSKIEMDTSNNFRFNLKQASTKDSTKWCMCVGVAILTGILSHPMQTQKCCFDIRRAATNENAFWHTAVAVHIPVSLYLYLFTLVCLKHCLCGCTYRTSTGYSSWLRACGGSSSRISNIRCSIAWWWI